MGGTPSSIFERPSQALLEEILDLKRATLGLRRSLIKQRDVLHRLACRLANDEPLAGVGRLLVVRVDPQRQQRAEVRGVALRVEDAHQFVELAGVVIAG